MSIKSQTLLYTQAKQTRAEINKPYEVNQWNVPIKERERKIYNKERGNSCRIFQFGFYRVIQKHLIQKKTNAAVLICFIYVNFGWRVNSSDAFVECRVYLLQRYGQDGGKKIFVEFGLLLRCIFPFFFFVWIFFRFATSHWPKNAA